MYSGEISAEQLLKLKEIIASEAVFFPKRNFEDRLKNQKENPHLILSSYGFRMRRANSKMWKEYIDAGKATMDDKTKRRANLVCHENPQEMIYVTDNANSRFKGTFKEAGLEFTSKKYEICHIGNNTVHDLATFGAIPNLVFLPRWIASATDHLVEIQDFLLEKSYSLYYLVMQEHMKDFDIDQFFQRLCNNDPKRFEAIQAHVDANKYQWKKTDSK